MAFDGTVEWVLKHAEEARDLIIAQQTQLDALSKPAIESLPPHVQHPLHRIAVPDVEHPWWRVW